MGAGAFYDCTNLLSVTFASGGGKVKMGDDLFARCWRLYDVTLPESIDSISARMFQNCYGALYSVSIPQGAAKIGDSAFASCSVLTALTIPDSVTDIETGAFSSCKSLKDIYYTGTEAQWKSIWKATNVTEALANVTIHYQYSQDDDDDNNNPDIPGGSDIPGSPDNSEDLDTPGSSNLPDSSDSVTAPITVPELVPNTGIPFIKGESGKNGWEAIKEDATNALEGEQIIVNMNHTSTVPGNVIDSIKGKNITLVFDMGSELIWYVNGKNVTAEHANDVDFSVQVGTSAIPKNVVESVAGNCQTTQLALAYNGSFGYSAVLMIHLGLANAGLYANLFYYNESAGKLEFVTTDQINENGFAELAFSHASDYVIVVGDEAMSESFNQNQPGSSGGSADNSDFKGAETRRSPATGEFNAARLQHEGKCLNLMWLSDLKICE